MREYGDVQYNMDYVEIYRVLCCDSQREFPDYITAGCHEVPVDFYTLSEEALKMPYVVTGGGHYTVGDKNYTKRKNLNNYQLIVTVEGSGIVEMNNQTFICEKGSAILLTVWSIITHDASPDVYGTTNIFILPPKTIVRL